MYKHIIAILLCVIMFSSWVYAEEHNIQRVPLGPPEQPPQVSKPVKPETPAFPKPMFRVQARPHGTIFQVNKRLECNDTDVMENAIENIYKEIPLTFGLVRNRMGAATMITILYVNPKTKAYTIVEHASSGVSCIITSGQEFSYKYNYDIFDQGSRVN